MTGIILAGGKSSRMGFDKGLLEVHGKKCIEYLLDALSAVSDHIIISANSDSYNYLNFPVYEDTIKDCGPLGGIYTALNVSQTERNIIVACDMPFISVDLLKFFIDQSEGYQIAVPITDGKRHPLCGYYAKHIVPQLKTLLQNKVFKMQEILKSFNTKEIVLDASLSFYSPKLLANINSQQELSQVLKTNC